MTSPIVLFGASGLLGSHIATTVIRSGRPLRAVSRSPEKLQGLRDLGAEVVRADMLEPSSLQAAVRGAAGVISTANSFMSAGRHRGSATDMAGNLNLIAACEQQDVQRFIFVSATAASPDSPVDFFRWKAEVELALQNGSLSYTVIRPTKFAEFWGRMIADNIRAGRPAIVFGKGNFSENYVSVIDVARVIDDALADSQTLRRVIRVRGPENLTALEVVRECELETGGKANVRKIPMAFLRSAGRLLRYVHPVASRMLLAATIDDGGGNGGTNALDRPGATTFRETLKNE
ncbi:MAG: SDR family oxidoreductase [Longimicrobiales bacterium]